MKTRHIFLLVIAILTGLVTVAGVLFLTQPYTFKGVYYETPIPVDDFSLKDQNGNTFQLADQKGKVVLIFFGYTYCPDSCPVTLSDYRQIKTILGDRVEDVRFVFVTVDPERDTPERINSYLEIFDPSIIGLTGDQADLQTVWDTFFVYQERVEVDSASGYLVDHTSRVYLVDKHGDLSLTFYFGTTPDEMAQDVIYLLERN